MRYPAPERLEIIQLVDQLHLPVEVGLELFYYVEAEDDFGPAWQLRLLVVPAC